MNHALVMKGGGIKGLAYVGAVQILEERYEFDWFIGTSAGAITAVLLAAGYSTDELTTILQEKNFKEFLDAPWYAQPWNLVIHKGVHKADSFTDWLAVLLARKLKSHKRVRLSELPYRATVYACKRDEGTLKFDSVDNDADAAHAVRCSMSIPWVFTPQPDQGIRAYDGGIRQNFPVKQLVSEYPTTPFVSLYLGSPYYEPSRTSVLADILSIATEGNDAKLIEEYREQTVIIDPRPIKTLDFSLSEPEKAFLLSAGRVGALAHLEGDNEELDQEIVALEKKRKEVREARDNRPQYPRLKRFALFLLLAVICWFTYSVVIPKARVAWISNSLRSMGAPTQMDANEFSEFQLRLKKYIALKPSKSDLAEFEHGVESRAELIANLKNSIRSLSVQEISERILLEQEILQLESLVPASDVDLKLAKSTLDAFESEVDTLKRHNEELIPILDVADTSVIVRFESNISQLERLLGADSPEVDHFRVCLQNGLKSQHKQSSAQSARKEQRPNRDSLQYDNRCPVIITSLWQTEMRDLVVGGVAAASGEKFNTAFAVKVDYLGKIDSEFGNNGVSTLDSCDDIWGGIVESTDRKLWYARDALHDSWIDSVSWDGSTELDLIVSDDLSRPVKNTLFLARHGDQVYVVGKDFDSLQSNYVYSLEILEGSSRFSMKRQKIRLGLVNENKVHSVAIGPSTVALVTAESNSVSIDSYSHDGELLFSKTHQTDFPEQALIANDPDRGLTLLTREEEGYFLKYAIDDDEDNSNPEKLPCSSFVSSIAAFRILRDGKIVVAGQRKDSLGNLLVRFTKNMDVDTSWGDDGLVDLQGPADVPTVALTRHAPTGQSLIAGYSHFENGFRAFLTLVGKNEKVKTHILEENFKIIDATFDEAFHLYGVVDNQLIEIDLGNDGELSKEAFEVPDATFSSVVRHESGAILIGGYQQHSGLVSHTNTVLARLLPSGQLDKSGFGENGIINKIEIDDFEDANAVNCLAALGDHSFVGGYVTAGANAIFNPGTQKGVVFKLGADGEPMKDWGTDGYVKLPFIPEQIEAFETGLCVAVKVQTKYDELSTLHYAVIDQAGKIIQKNSYEETLVAKLTRKGLYRGVQEGRHIRVYSLFDEKKTEYLAKALPTSPVAVDVVDNIGCVLVYSKSGELIRRLMEPVVAR